jgi:hypothetical protein
MRTGIQNRSIGALFRRIPWVFLFLLLLLVRWILTPQQIEIWYSRGIFLWIRDLQSTISEWSTWPLIYWLLGGLLLYVVVKIWRWRSEKAGWKTKGLQAGLGILNFLAGLAFWFMFLWGIQYSRPPMEEQLGLTKQALTESILEEEFHWATHQLKVAYSRLPSGYAQIIQSEQWAGYLEPNLQESLADLAGQLGYPVVAPVRSRLLFPRGSLLHFSSSGVYLPWVGEGHVDPGLHPIQWPFVMAHEMGHGFGITDEGNCNLVGFLTSIRHSDPVIQYAGWLGYWRYLASDYRRGCPSNYALAYEQLPSGIQADLKAIYEYQIRYMDWMPELRDVAYETYLKAQGISEGLANYDNIIMMVYQMRRHPKWKNLF